MKIVIFNQPTNNRGDEAAHRSLIRRLNVEFPYAEINVLFFQANPDSVEQMKVKGPLNTYTNVQGLKKGSGFLQRWGLRLNLIRLSTLHPTHRVYTKKIKEADLIICAPGGICMGIFQSWLHIYWLSIAKLQNKKIVYYSRSFGTFPEASKWNKVFKSISYNLLRYFDFLSIRDSKTMELADKIGIKYIPSIDTAFLDVPQVNIPLELSDSIGNNYVVFVPNTLKWHPSYKDSNTINLDEFYLAIMDLLLEKYPSSKIIMLPQIFNEAQKSDELYFHKLKSKRSSNRIVVISDKYGSDIQQTIISKAKLVIGARYHSVVFAINNNVPFIALSYEHKIAGLLHILGKEDSMFDIESLGYEQINISLAIQQIQKIMENLKADSEAAYKARSIANKCMSEFIIRYRVNE
jgi:colanic acid/amylovoran biosynthesis protein